jgi:DNA-binding MarR family transcriptional regulator
MDFDLLTNIVEAYKLYQLEGGAQKKSSLTDFAAWLQTKQTRQPIPTVVHPVADADQYGLEIAISTLIIGLNRYARQLVKKGLVDFPQLVSEDFTYLYSLMEVESMTKIQLIEKNVHEKPTGLEVIKRLLKHGLVAERNHENDKRSKRVFLTEKGRALFFATVEHMNKVALIVAGDLTLSEKQELFRLLKKLEYFHHPIYLRNKEVTIDELLGKIKE